MIVMEIVDVTDAKAMRWDKLGMFINPACVPSVGQHVYRSRSYVVTDVRWDLPLPAVPPAESATDIRVIVSVIQEEVGRDY